MGSNLTISGLFPLPEEAKALRIFVGDWAVVGTLAFGGSPLKVSGSWKMSLAAGGWGILNIGNMDVEGIGAYQEVDIIGFEPNEKQLHLFSVTNTAATHDHKGNWVNQNTIQFLYEGLQEGKKFKEEITIKIQTSNTLLIHEVDTLDEQITSTMDITLTK